MKPVVCISLLFVAGIDVATARPESQPSRRVPGGGFLKNRFASWKSQLDRREVPAEHSHEKFVTLTNTKLQLNNPDNIQDAVFGLLGNAAGSAGQDDITDTDCLQQATADQAFTNAKVATDVDGMTAALIYRTLERNTAAVGQASVLCTSITAVNSEIAALTQHQDPASAGAATTNKNIVLTLAVQIANIGGNPLDALQSGTFTPGQIGDPTAAGNTCDEANDPIGCIFTQNLLVEDATEDEVHAAVAASATANAVAAVATDATATQDPAAATECTADTVANATATTTATEAAATTTTAAKASTTKVAAAASTTTAASAVDAATGSTNAALPASCNARIIFANNLDGRNEPSFAPADETLFTHGSALNIEVISGFICTQIADRCNVGQAVFDQCNQADTAAPALTGQAAADAFNQGLGL